MASSSSSSSSTKRRLLSCEEKENNQNDNRNDGVKKTKTMPDDQMKIRNQVIEEFRNRNLEIPVQMIGGSLDGYFTNYKSLSLCFIDMIDRSKTSKTNRNDVEHRKELYTRLSSYLDHRKVRNRGCNVI
jgi:hypothetical protein